MALQDAPFLLVGTSPFAENARSLTTDPVSSNLLFQDSGPGNDYTLRPILNLESLAGLNTLGLTTYLGNNSFVSRSLASNGSISIPDPAGTSGNIVLSVVDSTSTQKVNVQADGTPVSLPQSTLNFVSGSNMSISANSVGGGIIDITFTSTGGGGGGGVTSITAGTGLTGGTITTTGTIALAPIADVEGSYVNATIDVDGEGRIIAASNGEVGGSVTSITAGTGLSGGTITTSGTITLANIADVAGEYINPHLTVDGQGRITVIEDGDLGGTVTSITAGAGLSGGTITTSGTISLPTITGVSGEYINPHLTVDDQGRITTIENGETPTDGTVTSVGAGPQMAIVGGGSAITSSGSIGLATLGTAGTYLTPSSVTLNAYGQVSAIIEGSGTAGINTINVQTLTADGTYTPTAGMVYCIVEVTAGGGSGSSPDGSEGAVGVGSGGAGGGYASVLYMFSDIGGPQPVTVGAGGTAVTGGSLSGNAGGDSSFGSGPSAILCAGGAGGKDIPSSGGDGTVAEGGVADVSGVTGKILAAVKGTSVGAGYHDGGSTYFLAAGGGSYYGASTPSFYVTNADTFAGIDGVNPGEGGTGALTHTSTQQSSGGGADGVIVITEYIVA